MIFWRWLRGLGWIAVLWPALVWAQGSSPEDQIPLFDQGLEFEAAYEPLAWERQQILDLNTCTAQQMQQKGLSDSLVAQIVRYRRDRGPFTRLMEVQTLAEYDSTWQSFFQEHFVVIPPSAERWHQGWLENRLWLRFQQRQPGSLGYQTFDPYRRFTGSASEYAFRYQARKEGHFSMGLSSLKQAGEPWLWRPQNAWFGAESYAAFVQLERPFPGVKKVLVGDFLLSHGQGLLYNQGFVLGRGSDPVAGLFRPDGGLVPWNSTYQAGFLRGLALELGNQTFSLRPYFSRRLGDGRLRFDSLENETGLLSPTVYSSAYNTGLFRNEAERDARHTFIDYQVGSQGIWHNSQQGYVAIAGHTRWQQGLGRAGWTGRSSYLSLVFSQYWGNHHVFGEGVWQVSPTAETALLGGWQWAPSAQWELGLLARRYSEGYRSDGASAFRQRSQVGNEKGLYPVIRYLVSPRWTVSASGDMYKALDTGIYPYSGGELTFRTDYTPKNRPSVTLWYRQWVRYRAQTQEGQVWNAQVRIPIRTNWQLSLRGQYTHQELGRMSQGWGGYAETRFQQRVWTLVLRYAYFDTDDYASRLYWSEAQVPGLFAAPAQWGLGQRTFALLKVKLTNRWALWGRWAQTRLSDWRIQGPGLDELDFRQRNEFTLQVVWNGVQAF